MRYEVDEDPRVLHTFTIPPPPPASTGGRGKGPPHYDIIAISPDEKVVVGVVGSSLQWLSLEDGELLETAEEAHEGRGGGGASVCHFGFLYSFCVPTHHLKCARKRVCMRGLESCGADGGGE